MQSQSIWIHLMCASRRQTGQGPQPERPASSHNPNRSGKDEIQSCEQLPCISDGSRRVRKTGGPQRTQVTHGSEDAIRGFSRLTPSIL